MNQHQRRGVVAGFFHVLQTTPEVFKEWMETPKDDPKAVGELVQRTLGLSQCPSSDDLNKMAAYADKELKPQIERLQRDHEGVPTHAGTFFATQQQ
jgi:hypothetical protein